METVILTFGMRKSASSYCYQITRDLFNRCRSGQAAEINYSEATRNPFVPDVEFLKRVVSETAPGTMTVRKTHLGLCADIRSLITSGVCFPVVQIRDPSDILVSLIDAGERERKKPAELRREGFAAIRDFEDTLPIVREDMKIARDWIELAVERDLPCVDFEFVVDHPVEYLRMIAARFGLTADFSSIVESYRRDPTRIWEFNQGRTGRGRKYRQAMQAVGLDGEVSGFRYFLRSRADCGNCRFGDWIYDESKQAASDSRRPPPGFDRRHREPQ